MALNYEHGLRRLRIEQAKIAFVTPLSHRIRPKADSKTVRGKKWSRTGGSLPARLRPRSGLEGSQTSKEHQMKTNK